MRFHYKLLDLIDSGEMFEDAQCLYDSTGQNVFELYPGISTDASLFSYMYGEDEPYEFPVDSTDLRSLYLWPWIGTSIHVDSATIHQTLAHDSLKWHQLATMVYIFDSAQGDPGSDCSGADISDILMIDNNFDKGEAMLTFLVGEGNEVEAAADIDFDLFKQYWNRCSSNLLFLNKYQYGVWNWYEDTDNWFPYRTPDDGYDIFTNYDIWNYRLIGDGPPWEMDIAYGMYNTHYPYSWHTNLPGPDGEGLFPQQNGTRQIGLYNLPVNPHRIHPWLMDVKQSC